MIIYPTLFLLSEWIDFPRGDQHLPNGKRILGNNFSFDKCRRRFDLVSFCHKLLLLSQCSGEHANPVGSLEFVHHPLWPIVLNKGIGLCCHLLVDNILFSF